MSNDDERSADLLSAELIIPLHCEEVAAIEVISVMMGFQNSAPKILGPITSFISVRFQVVVSSLPEEPPADSEESARIFAFSRVGKICWSITCFWAVLKISARSMFSTFDKRADLFADTVTCLRHPVVFLWSRYDCCCVKKKIKCTFVNGARCETSGHLVLRGIQLKTC